MNRAQPCTNQVPHVLVAFGRNLTTRGLKYCLHWSNWPCDNTTISSSASLALLATQSASEIHLSSRSLTASPGNVVLTSDLSSRELTASPEVDSVHILKHSRGRASQDDSRANESRDSRHATARAGDPGDDDPSSDDSEGSRFSPRPGKRPRRDLSPDEQERRYPWTGKDNRQVMDLHPHVLRTRASISLRLASRARGMDEVSEVVEAVGEVSEPSDDLLIRLIAGEQCRVNVRARFVVRDSPSSVVLCRFLARLDERHGDCSLSIRFGRQSTSPSSLVASGWSLSRSSSVSLRLVVGLLPSIVVTRRLSVLSGLRHPCSW